MYSTDKNHCVEANKAVTVLPNSLTSGAKPPKVHILFISNVNTLLEAIY